MLSSGKVDVPEAAPRYQFGLLHSLQRAWTDNTSEFQVGQVFNDWWNACLHIAVVRYVVFRTLLFVNCTEAEQNKAQSHTNLNYYVS